MAEIGPIRDRLRVWREVAWSHWKAAVMTLYGVVCFLEFARDHWATDALRARLHFLPNLTWQGWTIGALALLVVVTFEGAYRVVRDRERLRYGDHQTRSGAADTPNVTLDTPTRMRSHTMRVATLAKFE